MIKSYKDKLERGVSPVVGVILMVAVTVILAAVIGSFVLNLGGSVSQPAQAGVTVDTEATGLIDTTDNGDDTDADTTEYSVDVQLTNKGNSDSIKIQATDTDNTQTPSDPTTVDSGLNAYDPSVGTTSLNSVGDISTVTQLTEGDKASVIGVVDGEETVIRTITVE